MKKSNVLVLANDYSKSLAIIRSLGRSNSIVVDLVCNNTENLLWHSKFINEKYELPEYEYNSELWVKKLTEIIQRKKYNLVIPCNDTYVIPLQKHQEVFKKYSNLYLLNKKSFEVLFDKYKTNELARKFGVNILDDILINNKSDLKELLLTNLDFPLVIKPIKSFVVEKSKSKLYVEKVFNRNDLKEKIESMLNSSSVIIQKNFIGKGVGIELLMQDGKILYSFQHIRVHEPMHGGASSYRKSTKIYPDLLNAAKKILAPLKYTGIAMVEFKYNFKTHDWIFIEINPRFWGSISLSVKSGANFPLFLYQMLVEKRYDFSISYKKNIFCRNLTKDISWQKENYLADKSDPYLLSIPIYKVFMETFFNVILLRERIDSFAIDDPKPFFVEINNIIKRSLFFFKKKYCYFKYNTILYRFLEKRRIEKAFANNRKILFVCKGNINRSPFAEYILKKNSNKYIVNSAGYIKKEGRSSPIKAIQAAKRKQIYMQNHSSKILDISMLTFAQMIIVFDFDNYIYLTKNYKQIKNKLFFLGASNIKGSLFINDPHKQTDEYYDLIYSKIEDSIFSLLKKSKRK